MRPLFIDIETVPPEMNDAEKRALAADSVPGNISKSETIAKWIDENQDNVWRKLALNPLRGQVVAIGVAIGDEDVVVFGGVHERELMDELAMFVNRYATDVMAGKWCGHNIAGFDLPWLHHRAVKYGLNHLLQCIPFDRFDKRIADTMLMWAGSDYQNKTSVNDICAYLGITTDDEVDGSQVPELWYQGDVGRELVYAHCRSDVSKERELYKRLRFGIQPDLAQAA